MVVLDLVLLTVLTLPDQQVLYSKATYLKEDSSSKLVGGG